MYIPNGLTETEIITAIDKVAGRLSLKFAFACYTADDLKQQCFVWSIENLHKYEPGRPLENFLQVVLKNKLRNLKRDKLRRAEVPCKPCNDGTFCSDLGPCTRHLEWSRKNKTKSDIMYPVHLDAIDEETETSLQVTTSLRDAEAEELSRKVAERLPARLRADYLRMIDGAIVPSERRKTIKDEVRKILWVDFAASETDED